MHRPFKKRVFIDVDAIGPGTDYVEALTRAVESCDVLVAVIGRRWLTVKNKQGRRLDDPQDWVRVEVRTALARGVRVIPVLTGGAAMPTREKLPDDLAGLARLNALHIRHESFHADAAHLVTAIGIGAATATSTLVKGTGARASAVPASVAPASGVTVAAARKTAKVSQGDSGRAARLFDEAERVANAITDTSDKAAALSCVAAAVAGTEPDRASRLFDEAERIARSAPFGKYSKGTGLHGVATAMATVNPDRAERIANSITDKYWSETGKKQKAAALANIAKTIS